MEFKEALTEQSVKHCDQSLTMTAITQLSQLGEVGDSDFTVSFVDSMKTIFQWAHADVISTITKRNMDILSTLRNKLCDQVKDQFPDFNSKVPINRRVKHLVAKDIWILGDCLVKGIATSELERSVFNQNPLNTENDNGEGPSENVCDEHSECMDTVIALIKELQLSISTLVTENKQLKETVECLVKRSNCKCQAHTSPGQQIEIAVPEGSNSGSNSEAEGAADTPHAAEEPQHGTPLQTTVHPVKTPLTSAPGKTTGLSSGPTLNKTTPLQASPSESKKEIYVGNVNIVNSCEDIASHLSSIGIDVPVPDVRLLRKIPEAKSSSYCVKVNEKDFGKTTDTVNSMWPAGIKVRPFLEKPPRGLQSGKTWQVNHKRNSTGNSSHSRGQPFRPPPKKSYAQRREYISRNRFEPLQYDQYDHEEPWYSHEEYDYEREWPKPERHRPGYWY